ncbi:hypothetical protein ACFQZZ_15060 [Nocardia sp. GCM10030253]|uniref:hypothetical protein n=1 Tax=Nocardia sp. GCM10030253 TaxID=3273404 RepID=UPI00363BB218
MPDKQPDAGVSIRGGQVVAGNIGGSGNTGSVHGAISFGGSDQDKIASTLEQLRAELAELRASLAAIEGSDAEPGDVDDVVEALDGPEPNIEQAAGRWTRLLRRIPESLRDLDTVSKIVGLLGQLRDLTA